MSSQMMTIENNRIQASVPCRVDFGGTLDISTFYLPLGYASPSTFNMALDLRTRVSLTPWKRGWIRVESRGFDSAEFKAKQAPYTHPMGLMFAVADFFDAQGICIAIESSSPPRSALGGSSCAAVAMVAAFARARGETMDPRAAALTAHAIESSVAGVPCGLQDQLAAAYGGVHQWHWKTGSQGPGFVREPLIRSCMERKNLDASFLVAYGGRTHVSGDVNGQWVKRFLSGENRDTWKTIAALTRHFSAAVKNGDVALAGEIMNQETLLRLAMTPEVLDDTGRRLFQLAGNAGCGARFTGAGAGGCVWAIGLPDSIRQLKQAWMDLLSGTETAVLLETSIDPEGIKFY